MRALEMTKSPTNNEHAILRDKGGSGASKFQLQPGSQNQKVLHKNQGIIIVVVKHHTRIYKDYIMPT